MREGVCEPLPQTTNASGTPHRQLVLVYLANDVCQQARARKREELVREFASVRV